MRLASRLGVLLAIALFILPFGVATAQLKVEPISGEFSQESAVPLGHLAPQSVQALTVIYDNSAAGPNFGFSSTDLAAVWGDELLTTNTGILSTHKFTIYNPSTSAGPLLTAQVNVQFYDAITSTNLGGYITNVNFGSGLPTGFFSTVTVTGIDPLVIFLSSIDLIVTQTILAQTGSATALGIVSRNPPSVGSSPISMYISATTVGVPGFYVVSGLPSNPGYQVAVNEPPTGTQATTWGRIRKIYR